MLRIIYKYMVICLLLPAVASSCVYPYTPEVVDVEAYPVFDGRIIIGDKAELNYSTLQPLMTDGTDLTGYTRQMYPANFPWWVEDQDGNRFEPGKETGQADLSATVPGKSYRLCAQWNGQTYTSDWLQSMDENPVLDKVDFAVSEFDDNVRVYVSFHDDGPSSGFVALSFDETWEFHAEYMMDYVVIPESWEVIDRRLSDVQNYWCWAHSKQTEEQVLDLNLTNGKMISYELTYFSRKSDRCHRKYSIQIYIRSISEQEYEFMKNLTVQGSGSGGSLFTPNPGEIPGNIRCTSDASAKAFGYVTISNSSSRRYFLDTADIRMVPKAHTSLLIPTPEQYETLYNMNYRPVMDTFVDDVAGIGWGPYRCIDCVAAGGTLERPDYWQ